MITDLAVTMLREGVALGVLTLTRTRSEVRLPAGHHTGAAEPYLERRIPYRIWWTGVILTLV